MENLAKKYKYTCIAKCKHWGGEEWNIGDIINSATYALHEQKECFEPIELTIKERFDDFRKGMKLSYEDIANITGNTEALIKSVINSGKIPNWVHLSIWMYEVGQYRNEFVQDFMRKAIESHDKR